MASFSNSGGNDSESDQVAVLAFSLADRQYCVRVDAVISVLGVGDTSTVDTAEDPWNAGSITVDGDQVRVVDLQRIFGPTNQTPNRADESELIVLSEMDESDARYGWLVDDVDVTRTVSTIDLEPARRSARFVKGSFEFDGRELVWLDEREIHP
ncbi:MULTISPECIES: chemotaxis protein CheW [Natrialba]|uniref:CheW domain-containing protein n=1 Tax=Natrialba swarupiae TaxID=2448032 RepID=A0A5D5APW7_9EURY|nr:MULTISPECIES: chemotaxis protein CheW [Natrialba]MCW8172619.1 chemotaxis protein CheW [Natrialba swarupiae]MWV39459.1 chemotaxis protein CheW [Natrialba sp. INN-245]TYT63064.1 CheW domain-containing protein [Natrialba swarupiae]